MDELKKWLLNKIGITHGKDGEKRFHHWKERSYAYEAVLKKIEQIESDAEFDEWYDSQVSGADVRSIACKNLCRQSWKAALEYANKTGQD